MDRAVNKVNKNVIRSLASLSLSVAPPDLLDRDLDP